MIFEATGDVFDYEAAVVPVNCAGIAGAGLALQFRRRFPDSYAVYRELCDRHGLRIGTVAAIRRQEPCDVPLWLVMFPTKQHPWQKSRLEWIEAGVGDLVRKCAECGMTSVGIPRLWCGLGGLKWREVRAVLVRAFSACPEIGWTLVSEGGGGAC